MTRLYTEGAEFGDTLFWTDIGGVVASAGQKRTGAYSYYGSAKNSSKNITASTEIYFRAGHYRASTGAGYIIRWYNGATQLGGIYIESGTGKWQGYVSTSAVITGTNSIIPDQWQLIECHVKIADSGGKITLYVDGVLEFDYTGDTKPGAATTIDVLTFTYVTGGVYFDDIAINDTTGVVDNSWCGDGHIELLIANDNGDVNDWDGSDGDSVNNYLLVDERPHDSDTTYVKTSVTEQDMYNVSDYDPTGGKIVTRIFSECRAKDNAALSGAIKIGYKHGGAVYLSGERILTSAYARVVGDDALTDPSDSTTWSEADLDAIQFVVECSSSSSTSSSSSSSSTTSSSSTVPP